MDQWDVTHQAAYHTVTLYFYTCEEAEREINYRRTKDVTVGSGGHEDPISYGSIQIILPTGQQMAALYLKVQAEHEAVGRSGWLWKCLLLCDLFCPLQFLDTHFEEKPSFWLRLSDPHSLLK